MIPDELVDDEEERPDLLLLLCLPMEAVWYTGSPTFWYKSGVDFTMFLLALRFLTLSRISSTEGARLKLEEEVP